jgi:two-component system, cell cycle sensor histidine kinase and response regulator CckA
MRVLRVASDGPGFDGEGVSTLDELQRQLAGEWDVLVTSDRAAMPLETVVRAVHEHDQDLPVVALVENAGDAARSAIAAGARAVVTREHSDLLEAVVQRAAEGAAESRRQRLVGERFRAAVEGGFDSFIVLDAEHAPDGELEFRFAELNTRARALLGDVAGKRFSEIVSPESGDRVRYFSERFRTVFETGVPFQEEYEVQSADIEARRLHYQVVALENGVAVTVRDVTQRLEAETALRLRDRAIEAMTQGLVIVDAQTEGFPIVYANRAFQELTGYKRNELLGRSPTMLNGPDTSAASVAAIKRAFAEGRAFSGDIVTYRKDGTSFLGSMRISPVTDEGGTVTHFISIHVDETPRRKLEEQFMQAQKMEVLGRLAGGVAHDFNNVLLVIRGYSHLLMTMAGEDGEGWAEAKEIEDAATRASDLVRQLLAFSRSQILQTRVVDLNSVVDATQRLVEPLLGAEIELQTSLDPRLGAVKADPTQLEQALINLAVNARDAMPRGGRLSIKTRNVVLDASSPTELPAGMYSTLSVEDTGHGMDAFTQARIFEPFFSTKASGEGSGLGLSAVYGVVKQSGGEIVVSSAVDEGTTFTIYLPHAPEEIQASLAAGDDAPNVEETQAETVLLVEDDTQARELVGRLLRSSGYSVHEAALPDDALQFVDGFEGTIDLLLSDVVMPQMSGPTLAKRVLELRPGTRVMFVSGYVDSAADADVVTSGADFLQKPFTPAELIQTVRRALSQEPVA